MASAGKDVPALERRPTVIGYEWLWEAFQDLGTCRPGGMSLMSIPWTATQKYAETLRLGESETYLLHYVIRAMDARFHEHAKKHSGGK